MAEYLKTGSEFVYLYVEWFIIFYFCFAGERYLTYNNRSRNF
jgi:hypothetical protein